MLDDDIECCDISHPPSRGKRATARTELQAVDAALEQVVEECQQGSQGEGHCEAREVPVLQQQLHVVVAQTVQGPSQLLRQQLVIDASPITASAATGGGGGGGGLVGLLGVQLQPQRY